MHTSIKHLYNIIYTVQVCYSFYEQECSGNSIREVGFKDIVCGETRLLCYFSLNKTMIIFVLLRRDLK